MLIFLATLVMTFAAPGTSPDAVEKASEKTYKADSYQRELPVAGPLELGKNGTTPLGKDGKPRYGKDGRYKDGSRNRRPPPERQERSSALNSISNALLWLLTFVVIAVFALWLVREFLGYLPDAEAELEAAVLDEGQANAVVSAPLQDAKLLAQRGQYGEAIHALLLRTLMELSRTYPEPLAPSLTSREILRALQLSPAAHDALTGLISAVELCHFRGSPPRHEDYSRCLQHFEVFARAYVKQERAA